MNKNKLKVITIVGTRPEVIRLSRTIAKLDAFCDHILVHTGQNYDYELNEIFFKDLEIREPDFYLGCAGKSAADTMSKVISKSDILFEQHRPDALLILGDTNSALAAIPAKRRKIPIFHMEAGNRCFDLRVPEEINRKLVDHISDVNLPYSSIARQYLLDEGIKPEFIVKTGSPMYEVIEFYKNKIDSSSILTALEIEEKKYFVVSVHREENLDSESNIKKFVQVLEELSSSYKLPIIVSAHPRTRKKIQELEIEFPSYVRLMKPLSFSDYVHLQSRSKLVFSDSGTITEESSILNFPALNIREAQERPEGLEEGAVMFTGMEVERIFQCIDILNDQSQTDQRSISIVADYLAPNVSDKILKTIHSYVDYVNKYTWKK